MLTESETLAAETVQSARLTELDSAVVYQYIISCLYRRTYTPCCRVFGALEHSLQVYFSILV